MQSEEAMLRLDKNNHPIFYHHCLPSNISIAIVVISNWSYHYYRFI